MSHLNIEIKARYPKLDSARSILRNMGADFKGVDHQRDTYFKTENGKLKLREGNIENYLVYYDREGRKGLKKSEVSLLRSPGSELKEILSNAFGILVVVEKEREIYYIDNVKFHLDTLSELGTFIEIEAMSNNEGDNNKLREQCRGYMRLLKIEKKNLVAESYSDLLLNK